MSIGLNERQKKLINLIQEKEIDTQFFLAEVLQKAGYNVTQATVSRDIKALGLVKVPGKHKKTKYAVPVSEKLSRFDEMFRHSVISVDTAMNLIVIKTLTGSANAACSALDKFNFNNIVGTIAGDDTLLVIVKDVIFVEEIYNRIKEYLNN